MPRRRARMEDLVHLRSRRTAPTKPGVRPHSCAPSRASLPGVLLPRPCRSPPFAQRPRTEETTWRRTSRRRHPEQAGQAAERHRQRPAATRTAALTGLCRRTDDSRASWSPPTVSTRSAKVRSGSRQLLGSPRRRLGHRRVPAETWPRVVTCAAATPTAYIDARTFDRPLLLAPRHI